MTRRDNGKSVEKTGDDRARYAENTDPLSIGERCGNLAGVADLGPTLKLP